MKISFLAAPLTNTTALVNHRRKVAVHDTGNTSRGADAAAHAKLQARGNARKASWHYQVDDTQAIQSFDHKVSCWHAGDATGNREAIAVEICVNADGIAAKARENAAYLIGAKILPAENLTPDDVVQHNYYSGKNCPASIRKITGGWQAFLQEVTRHYLEATNTKLPTSKPATAKPKGKTIAQLADEVIAGKHGNGDARKKSLGTKYAQVQAEVNRRITGKTTKTTAKKTTAKPKGKTIAQLADEVIAGKHGNGDARKKSLGTKYAQVQAEVNRRLRK